MAVLISPMPPSSPTMNKPGTLVSKSSLTIGTLTVCSTPPMAIEIACVGQTSAHLECPVQRSEWARMALPFTSSRVPVSGHTSTHVPQPTHSEALIMGFGLPVAGPSPPIFTSARCKLHMASAAPQCAQNADPLGICLLQRGHGCIATGAVDVVAPEECFPAAFRVSFF